MPGSGGSELKRTRRGGQLALRWFFVDHAGDVWASSRCGYMALRSRGIGRAIIGTAAGLRWLSQNMTRYVLSTILGSAGLQLLFF
jgi:hypothetical protein